MDLECRKCKRTFHESNIITNSAKLSLVGDEHDGALCMNCFDRLRYKIDDNINNAHTGD